MHRRQSSRLVEQGVAQTQGHETRIFIVGAEVIAFELRGQDLCALCAELAYALFPP